MEQDKMRDCEFGSPVDMKSRLWSPRALRRRAMFKFPDMLSAEHRVSIPRALRQRSMFKFFTPRRDPTSPSCPRWLKG